MTTLLMGNDFDMDFEFEDTKMNNAKEGEVTIIHISVEMLKKGKKITTINGLGEEYDFDKILKYFKKAFNCNGSVKKDTKGLSTIQLSGDHRELCVKFFIEEGIADDDNIRVHGI